MSKHFVIESGGKLRGEIKIPGDKSISHRAIMLASIAQGNSQINGLLRSGDVLCTLAAMRAIGVHIEEGTDGALLVHGTQSYRTPLEPIYVGNSGTAMRLLVGLFAGLNISAKFYGDESLSTRPMKRVTDPLCSMGFIVKSSEGTAPLIIESQNQIEDLNDFNYSMPISSAQVKSCILLASLFSQTRTTISEPFKSRNHTELMFKDFGADIRVKGNEVTLVGGKKLLAHDVQVPSDISSASFFMVAASIIPDSDITMKRVGINSTRDGIIHLLKKMGADISIENKRHCGSEIVADIRVRSAPLNGIMIENQYISLAIDEFPILFVAAACAKGKTKLRNASELRTKESDRIAIMAQALQKMNIKTTEYEDGIDIIGGTLKPTDQILDSHNDHRIAMSLSVAAMAMKSGSLKLSGVETVASSFPNFHTNMHNAGMKITLQ
jgi:3-phosphoshikimate 1-carboxyvinyltransferase